MPDPSGKSFDTRALEDLLKQSNESIDIWKNVALSMSSYGNTRYPIMTIRLHNGTSNEAIDIKILLEEKINIIEEGK